MTATTTPARVFPLPAPPSDPRFSLGLLAEVATVLESHGYPRPESGTDLVALQLALHGFLYAAPNPARSDGG